MPDNQLPVYQIRNFGNQNSGKSDFYVSLFEEHLLRHKFIQKPHKHDFYIVLLITQGTGTHTIDFVTYPVVPGTVYFLSPGQVHSWQLSANTKGVITFFTADFYLLGFAHKKLLGFPFFNVLLKPFLMLSEPETNKVGGFLRQMELENRDGKWRSKDIIRNLLDVALITLTRIYHTQNVQNLPTPGHYSLLQQLDELIEQHFKEHKPVSFYAEQLHITIKQLNEKCRQSLARTTSEIIQARVLLEARRLLIHSDLTITQIAAELGYFDNSYFSRFFKKLSGETPDQFRKNQE